MDEREQQQIREWHTAICKHIQIEVNTNEDKRSNQLLHFCNELQAIADNIEILQHKSREEVPSIHVRTGIRYCALPVGRELQPFLQALSLTTNALSPSICKRLAMLADVTVLQLYITPLCPFCPVVVKQVLPLAIASELIQVVVIDSELFPELAEKNAVQAAPTLILDDEFRWTGSISIGEIVDVIVDRNPEQLSMASLEQMLEQKKAVVLSEMMVKRQRIFPAMFDLLAHEKWDVRLGAMVAMEDLTERDVQLAARAIPSLWKYFYQVDDYVKGDILYLLGKTKSQQVAGPLQAIIDGTYSVEVKEAAQEALEEVSAN